MYFPERVVTRQEESHNEFKSVETDKVLEMLRRWPEPKVKEFMGALTDAELNQWISKARTTSGQKM